MDQELAAFLSERFDEINRRFDDVYRRFDAIDQRFDMIDRRFDAVDRRFDAVDERFDAVDERFGAVDQRFGEVNRKIDEKFEEAKRHFGVVAEGLEGKIVLIAEGHLVLQRQLQEHVEQNQAEHRETVALLTSSYGDLDRRVTRLEPRRRRGGPNR